MQISVLGPLAARRRDPAAPDHGTELGLGGLRQRAVLARLAIARGDTVPVDRIVDDLWDGDPPPSGVSNLQSYVSNLRRVLRSGDHVVIERSGPGYRLEPGAVELVADRFEALVASAADGRPEERVALLDEALALWRGPALVEFADQAWAEAEASRLDELRLSAVEARFQALLDAGQHARVVPDLERAVAEHPLREQLTAQLVLALYRAGRQADALRAYERTRAHLAEELGLDPVPELVALADRVLAQDPDLALVTAVAPAAAPRAEPTPTPAPDRTSIEVPLPRAAVVGRAHGLVGREAELDRIEGALAALADGDTRATLVEGEAGVGKSTLVAAAVARFHDAGGLVLWGGCSPEHLVAYQPVVSALRALERDLAEQAAGALVARHPVLGQLLGRAGDAGVTAERDPFELYEAVADLLCDLAADQPVALVVDDLHWADRSSLALLGHLLAGGRVPGLGLVGTVRRPAGRPTVELDRFTADLRRRDGADVVDLTGIGPDDVAELLVRCGRPVDGAVADAVHARTGGNPLFVEALSAQADDLTATDPRQLPHTVRETLDLRTAELGAEDLQVLVTAAAIGATVDLRVLAEVAQIPLERVLDVVDVGVAAGLLVEDPETVGVVSFSHALARDALVARSTRNREAQLHLRIADVLEARPHGVEAAVLAQHLRAAGALCDPGRAAAAAIAAARHALELLAPDEARTWARRALATLDDETVEGGDDLRWKATSILSRTSRHLGDAEGAQTVAGELLDLARRSGEPRRLARAAEEVVLGTANVGFAFGALDEEMVALLDDVRAAIEAAPGDHPAEEATVLAWSTIVRAGGPPDQRQRDLAVAAADAASRCDDRPGVGALAALAQRLALPGPAAVDQRLVLHDRMIADAAAARWTEMEVLAHVLGATDLLEAGRVEESRRLVEVLRGRLAPHPRPGFDTYLHFLDAAFALLAGELDRAAELSELGLAQGQLAHGPNATQAWAAEQFVIAWERGQLAGFTPMTADMVAEFPDIAPWRAGHAAALVAAGEPEAAVDVVAPVLDGDRLVVPEDLLWSTAVAMLAEVAWAIDHEVLGQAVADALEPVQHRVAVTGMGALSLGHLVRHRGLARAAAGDLEAADAALAEAIERSDGTGFRTWAARARLERAEVLERLGRDGAALRSEGEAMAADLGIAPGLR